MVSSNFEQRSERFRETKTFKPELSKGQDRKMWIISGVLSKVWIWSKVTYYYNNVDAN